MRLPWATELRLTAHYTLSMMDIEIDTMCRLDREPQGPGMEPVSSVSLEQS